MFYECVDIIDIGGMSTRPGSKGVSEKEEINRIIPAIKIIRAHFPGAILSVDTYRANIARKAVEDFSVEIINDISGGGMDKGMFETIADLHVPYIFMHMKGSPLTMQSQTEYNDILTEIIDYFSSRIARLRSLGVADIIIDPGFGFSKTIEQNFYLLNRLETFRIFELPIMAGISRKSMIYRTLKTDASGSLNGTTVLNTIALKQGADILRVHDVKEAVQAVTLMENLKKQRISG